MSDTTTDSDNAGEPDNTQFETRTATVVTVADIDVVVDTDKQIDDQLDAALTQSKPRVMGLLENSVTEIISLRDGDGERLESPPLGVLALADAASASDIALVIDDHLESTGLVKAVCNENGTYTIHRGDFKMDSE